MNTQHYDHMQAQNCPTSPWTEAFQSSSAAHEKMQQQNNAQQSTHDALSDIENRGYSA